MSALRDFPAREAALNAVSGQPAEGLWTDANDVETLANVGGAYLLCFRLPFKTRIAHPGFCNSRPLQSGWYAYAGSAKGPGGLRARLARHFSATKTPHWHIDLLTVRAEDLSALAFPGGNECDLVSQLLGTPQCIPAVAGFGNSDCNRCPTHLLRLGQAEKPERVHGGHDLR